VTTSIHHPALWKRLTAPLSSPGRKPEVETVGGVKMSCQEIDADFALIRFVCPPASAAASRPLRKRAARRPARQT
jgi:hypothetical protein